MFEWVKGNVYTMILTLYPNNITLNSSAASIFQDVRWVMIGIDKTHSQLGICPVTKREIDLNLVPLAQLHKISVGKGYARISNKMIIEELSAMIDQPIDGLKINAVFDEKQNMLIADLHELSASKG
ncbi:hypothetical protein [Amedibacillus sp. YH-ame10]